MKETVFIPIEQIMTGVIEGIKTQSKGKVEVVDVSMGVEGLTLVLEREPEENKDV